MKTCLEANLMGTASLNSTAECQQQAFHSNKRSFSGHNFIQNNPIKYSSILVTIKTLYIFYVLFYIFQLYISYLVMQYCPLKLTQRIQYRYLVTSEQILVNTLHSCKAKKIGIQQCTILMDSIVHNSSVATNVSHYNNMHN